ncbi:MAG TPA: hypothetical protein VG410_14870 [Solirubrobacteraceae bacterium]|jgi:hypothetical protein|nr:hypothetical protein [Solirubrobacteraceae bacterium]
MSFETTPHALRCCDCRAEITHAEYRRKHPRCDDCEVTAALREFDGATTPAPTAGAFVRSIVHPWLPARRSWRLQLHVRRLIFEWRIALREDAA